MLMEGHSDHEDSSGAPSGSGASQKERIVKGGVSSRLRGFTEREDSSGASSGQGASQRERIDQGAPLGSEAFQREVIDQGVLQVQGRRKER